MRGEKNAATIALEQAVERVRYKDWQAIRIEVDTMRSYRWCFQSDADLIRELLELRAFRDAHPLPVDQKPVSIDQRPKSALIMHAEAQCLFGEYCEREAGRLGEKIRLMEADAFDDVALRADADERARHEKIGLAAISREAAAVQAWAAQSPQLDLLAGIAA